MCTYNCLDVRTGPSVVTHREVVAELWRREVGVPHGGVEFTQEEKTLCMGMCALMFLHLVGVPLACRGVAKKCFLLAQM